MMTLYVTAEALTMGTKKHQAGMVEALVNAGMSMKIKGRITMPICPK